MEPSHLRPSHLRYDARPLRVTNSEIEVFLDRLDSFTREFHSLVSFVTIEAMFARRMTVNRIDAAGERHACPIGQIDNFAMRNFTNDAVFDDTFPVADGILEAGNRVPLDQLQRRDGRLVPAQRLPET